MTHYPRRPNYFIWILALVSLIPFVAEAQQLAPKIELGIDVLEKHNFSILKGKRVGLLTHPAGVNKRGRSTLDILHQSKAVKLVALFGPEHGIYGGEGANVPVEDKIDKRTGLPVYSLYGEFRKPTTKMLEGLDTMVVDLQDIGVRSYTYASCLLYTMEACFNKGIEVIILDRPNPLGGLKIDGPMMEKQWMSYVGAYNTPYLHGMTIGELARWARGDRKSIIPGVRLSKKGKLKVVSMEGWKRSMLWPDTGLKWVATSPYIFDFSAVIGYAMTGLGAQLGGFQHGIGSPYPFRLLSYPGKDISAVEKTLKSKNIQGLTFKIVPYKDRRGNTREGLYVIVSDWNNLKPTELSFYMMQLACEWSQINPFKDSGKNEGTLFNKHVGSTAWWNEIRNRGKNARVSLFMKEWSKEAQSFQKKAQKYLLY